MKHQKTKSDGSSSINIIRENIPFFACLSEQELLGLSRIIVNKRFPKNKVIFFEDDTPRYMYIVYSGKVKVVQSSLEGKEQILAIHKRGDFFGEMSILDGKTSPATVTAMEDTRIGLIERSDFEKYLLHNERILRKIVSLLCARLRESWFMIKVLGFADAELKVRAVLKHVSAQCGIKDPRGTIIPLKLTHQDIANYASLSRETVTRLLVRFIKEGEIELIDNKYFLLAPHF